MGKWNCCKRMWCLSLCLVFFLPTQQVQAGEYSETTNLPDARILFHISFDDTFYHLTEDGQVDIRLNILNLYGVKVVITGVEVILCEGREAGCGPSWDLFTNPEIGGAGPEDTLTLNDGSRNWSFKPSSNVRVPTGLAWIKVRIGFRTYSSATNYDPWEFSTTPQDTFVQVIEKEEESLIPGFEVLSVLLVMIILVGIRRCRA